MSRLFAVAVAAVTLLTCSAPARAEALYYAVEGYGYPKDIVGGPFESNAACWDFVVWIGGVGRVHCEEAL